MEACLSVGGSDWMLSSPMQVLLGGTMTVIMGDSVIWRHSVNPMEVKNGWTVQQMAGLDGSGTINWLSVTYSLNSPAG
jgi:hypothetical protein